MTSLGMLTKGDFFVPTEGQHQGTLFRKQGTTSIPYDRFSGVRHGALQFYPDNREVQLPSDQEVMKLKVVHEPD